MMQTNQGERQQDKLGSGSGYRRMNNQNRVRGGGFKRVNMTVQTQVYWVGGPQKSEQPKGRFETEATER
jgi:hypothetical protein